MDKRVPTVTEKVNNNELHAVDLDQALDVAGLGWYNLKYCLVLALFLISSIVEPVGYSYLLPAARCDLDMTDAQRGFIASIPYIGIVITSFPWGYLVDTQGRKRVLIWSSLACGLFAMLSAFMPDLISFVAFKSLSALFIAGPASVPYSLIGELTPLRHRDLALSITNALQIMGSTFVPILAWAFLPLDFRVNFGLYDFRPWRALGIVYTSFFFLAAFFMSFGPESPKFLLSQGRNDEALSVLATIYAGNKRKSPKDFPVKMLQNPGYDGTKRDFLQSLKNQSVPLLRAPFHKWIALNGLLLFGVFATLNGLYVWVPDMLNRVVTGDSEGLTACEVIAQRLNETAIEGICDDSIATSTFIINIITNMACAVIAIVGSSTVKLFGKKTLVVFVFAIIGVFCSLANVITNDILFVIFFSCFPVLAINIGPINAYAVEIFPTNLRGMAISLTMMFGRFGSVVGANVAGVLFNTNCPSTFFVFGGSLLLCSLLTFLLPKSRTQQKPDKLSTRL